MMKTAIQHALAGRDLSFDDAFESMQHIMTGKATDAQIGAFLIAMRMKNETPEEIAAFAQSMRTNAMAVSHKHGNSAVDLVGTGGDGKHTFNISTVAALVVAGAGIPVAKHGNHSVSSKCGSADVLQALGVNIELDNIRLGHCLDEVGIAFIFAPMVHPAMKYAIGPRRDIGVRSFFNILGPITNPAGVTRQLIGVYSPDLLMPLAKVLEKLGAEHIMLVHSRDGLDEIALAGKTDVVELKNGTISSYEVGPDTFGISGSSAAIIGGNAAENAETAKSILGGEGGPARDIVIANAAAGLFVSGKFEDFQAAAHAAATSIDSGAASKKLDDLISCSQRLGE